METRDLSLRQSALWLALIWLLLNWPVLFGKSVLPWDAMDQFYPTVYFNAHLLREGIAPWWNPYIYSGYPQIADPQGMLFSPLLMGWMLLRAVPGPQWFDWGVLLHMLGGGIAMLAWLRRYRCSAWGALLGAMVFMAGGVASSRLEHVPIVVAYGYLPVALLALKAFIEAPSLHRGLLAGVVLGFFAVHLVQLTYLSAWLLAYGAVETMQTWAGYTHSTRWRWLAGLLLATLVAVAICLPQAAFTWAFANLSNRNQLPLSAAIAGSLDQRALLTLVVPNALHTLRGELTPGTDPVQSFLYPGVLAMLSLAGLFRAFRQPPFRRTIVFFGVVLLFSGTFMFGVHMPMYAWLYEWLPGLSYFRRPSDGAYFFNLAMAVLAAIGASVIPLEQASTRRWLLLSAALWLTLGSLSMYLPDRHFRLYLWLPLLTAIVIALWLRRSRATWQITVGLSVLMLLDLRTFNHGGQQTGVGDYVTPFLKSPALAFITQAKATHPGFRIDALKAPGTWDNGQSIADIANAQGYNPMRYALYDQWYGARDNGNLPWPSTPFHQRPDSALSRLLSVRFLIIGDSSDQAAYQPPAAFTMAYREKGLSIWENSAVYPHVLSPAHVQVLAVGQQPDPAVFEATDFTRTVWLTPRDQSDSQQAEMDARQCSGEVSVRQLTREPTRSSYSTQAQQAGWIAFSELDFPGWQATLDDQPIMIHRANGMFRAVCVPAGQHQLAFAFHPWQMVRDVLAMKRVQSRAD